MWGTVKLWKLLDGKFSLDFAACLLSRNQAEFSCSSGGLDIESRNDIRSPRGGQRKFTLNGLIQGFRQARSRNPSWAQRRDTQFCS